MVRGKRTAVAKTGDWLRESTTYYDRLKWKWLSVYMSEPPELMNEIAVLFNQSLTTDDKFNFAFSWII